jgi:hypothetical protein
MFPKAVGHAIPTIPTIHTVIFHGIPIRTLGLAAAWPMERSNILPVSQQKPYYPRGEALPVGTPRRNQLVSADREPAASAGAAMRSKLDPSPLE